MTTTRIRVIVSSTTLYACLLGCSATAPIGPVPENVEGTTHAIMNGTAENPWAPGTSPSKARAFVDIDNYGCGGLVVAPDWVVSARHCGLKLGQRVRMVRPAPLTDIERKIDRFTQSNLNDVVMVHLNAPMPADVPTVDLSLASHGKWDVVDGQTITCYGVGPSALATENNGQCWVPDADGASARCSSGYSCVSGWCMAGNGQLRSGNLPASLTAGSVGVYSTLTTFADQTTVPGDSGGPCFLGEALIGVNSYWGGDLKYAEHASIVMTGAWMKKMNRRMGVIASGRLYVKEGAFSNPWRDQNTTAASFKIEGDRIVALQADGTLLAKEGDLSAGWITMASNVASVQLHGPRVAILTTDGRFLVKEGLLTDAWTEIDSDVTLFHLQSTRIGWLKSDGHLWVKEGKVDADAHDMIADVTSFSVGSEHGNRVAALQNGHLLVREGLLSDEMQDWYDLYPSGGVTAHQMERQRIGILTSDRHLRVLEIPQPGTLDGLKGQYNWIDMFSNVDDFQMSQFRLAVRSTTPSASSVLNVAEVPLEHLSSATWVNLGASTQWYGIDGDRIAVLRPGFSCGAGGTIHLNVKEGAVNAPWREDRCGVTSAAIQALISTPSCSDGVRNESETDVDCGGDVCPACGTGRTCSLNRDCATNLCSGGVCKSPVTANLVVRTGSGGDWGYGYCADLRITNNSSSPTSNWSVTVNTNRSTIYTNWNGNFSGNSGLVTATPSFEWNRVIPPGATDTSLGFCANRAVPFSGSMPSLVTATASY